MIVLVTKLRFRKHILCMKIKSNALPTELNSPFYEANKTFCQVFERFIASKKGKVKGVYNAWSYVIFGKIKTVNAWNLKYKRAVYTGMGSIWFSSKYQNLLTSVIWTCNDIQTNGSTFFIRRKKVSDILIPSYISVPNHPKYVIKSSDGELTLLAKILTIVQPLFNSKEIYQIILKNNILTIELRSEEHHFDIFEQLSHLS